jgi:solute carrier family 25 carnitine/acylcarnitine transporter 20/29
VVYCTEESITSQEAINPIKMVALTEAWVDFIAGWGSGAVSVLICQPVDTVLTRFQANASTSQVALQETKYMMTHNGFKSLWRGSSAMISAVPMQNAMLMGGYGVGKKWSESSDSNSNIYLNVFVGGFCGGIAQSFLMSPVELMKVNQQVNVSKSTRDAGMELYHGLSRLAINQTSASSSSWRGLNATLLRDGIPHGVW